MGTANKQTTTETDKPVYRMSSVGCLRALVAPRLGYEPIKPRESSILTMDEASRHEYIVKDRLSETSKRLRDDGKAGFNIINDNKPCQVCLRTLGDSRYGYHVAIHTALFDAVGHLDTFFTFNDGKGNVIESGRKKKSPVVGEIKSFGKDTWTKFVHDPFNGYQVYLNQLSLYVEGLESPGGLFLLKNRDSGRVMVYAMGDVNADCTATVVSNTLGFEYGGEYDLPSATSIVTRIAEAEIWARDGELPPGEPEDFRCEWCNFRYLCDADKTLPVMVSDEELQAAAKAWDEADRRVKLADLQREEAKRVFIDFGRSTPRFVIGNLNVNYKGQRTRKVIDEVKLRALIGKKGLAAVKVDSKAWEDISIRRAGEAAE